MSPTLTPYKDGHKPSQIHLEQHNEATAGDVEGAMTRQETESIELTYIISLVSNDGNTEVTKAREDPRRIANHPLKPEPLLYNPGKKSGIKTDSF